MTTPLTPPTFGDKYSTPLTDIGSGYAAGITSAGNSIAGAIGAVMGGYNQRTGELQEGILDQKKSSEGTLDMLHMHGMMTDDEYAKAKTMSLGAQQKWIGQTTAEFNAKLQGELALRQAQAEQAAAMARTQVGESGARERTTISETGAEKRTQMQIDAEKAKQEQALAAKKLMMPKPVVPVPSTIPQVRLGPYGQ